MRDEPRPGQRPRRTHVAPREAILEAWKNGHTGPQIIRILQATTGESFGVEAIYRTVSTARDEGDPRAVERRGGWTPS